VTGDIPSALDGERVDRAVALLVGVTRAEAAGLIAGGSVQLAGRAVRSKARRVHAGERLGVDDAALPGPAAAVSPDPSVTVRVVHADDDVIVVDKPAGMVVHPGAGHERGTLVEGLLARFPDLAELAVGDAASRPGIVQRLDVGTSGLLVVARNEVARHALVEQLTDRRVERRYTALVTGTVDADDGVIDAPIGRSTSDPTRMEVTSGGRVARTRYRVEHRYRHPRAATLLSCALETGRTHQIRVHLAAIGHPVVGDPRYGPPGRVVGGQGGRPFLHAGVLGFVHPSGRALRFSSPLPEDLRDALAEYGE
jgi:23S rRNA pseudouridine1911/1915/1917 synthase